MAAFKINSHLSLVLDQTHIAVGLENDTSFHPNEEENKNMKLSLSSRLGQERLLMITLSSAGQCGIKQETVASPPCPTVFPRIHTLCF